MESLAAAKLEVSNCMVHSSSDYLVFLVRSGGTCNVGWAGLLLSWRETVERSSEGETQETLTVMADCCGPVSYAGDVREGWSHPSYP